ncbi:unnamed protein product [Sphagnum jensenii]
MQQPPRGTRAGGGDSKPGNSRRAIAAGCLEKNSDSDIGLESARECRKRETREEASAREKEVCSLACLRRGAIVSQWCVVEPRRNGAAKRHSRRTAAPGLRQSSDGS